MIKKISLILMVLLFLNMLKTPAGAANLVVQISDLSEYLNTSEFDLNYTAVQINNAPISAQFECQKEGEAWKTIGGIINGETGSVKTNNSQITSEGKYFCKVTANSDGETIESMTSTIIDWTGPSAPHSYGKEKINSNTYRLTWYTPDGDDFSSVIVYRYTEPNFRADSGSEIARIGGEKNSKIVWENTGLEIGRDYYYALRAIDKAGNISELSGDGGTVTTEYLYSTNSVPQVGIGDGSIINQTDNRSRGQVKGDTIGSETITGSPMSSEEQNNNELSKDNNFNPLLLFLGLGILVAGILFIRRQSD